MPSVTGKSHGNHAKRRDDVRRRLLAVVEQLLNDGETYAELSVERLASEAKLSRATFYVYFEDKGDLLRAWFTHVIEELEDAASAWWQLDGTATRDDLRVALGQIVHAYRPHTTLIAALYDISSYDVTAREGDDVAQRRRGLCGTSGAVSARAGSIRTCRPRKPRCGSCGWPRACARRRARRGRPEPRSRCPVQASVRQRWQRR